MQVSGWAVKVGGRLSWQGALVGWMKTEKSQEETDIFRPSSWQDGGFLEGNGVGCRNCDVSHAWSWER